MEMYDPPLGMSSKQVKTCLCCFNNRDPTWRQDKRLGYDSRTMNDKKNKRMPPQSFYASFALLTFMEEDTVPLLATVL